MLPQAPSTQTAYPLCDDILDVRKFDEKSPLIRRLRFANFVVQWMLKKSLLIGFRGGIQRHHARKIYMDFDWSMPIRWVFPRFSEPRLVSYRLVVDYFEKCFLQKYETDNHLTHTRWLLIMWSIRWLWRTSVFDRWTPLIHAVAKHARPWNSNAIPSVTKSTENDCSAFTANIVTNNFFEQFDSENHAS